MSKGQRAYATILVLETKVAAKPIRQKDAAFSAKLSEVDYSRKLVVWAVPFGSSQLPNELLIFSIRDGRWTHDALDLARSHADMLIAALERQLSAELHTAMRQDPDVRRAATIAAERVPAV